MTDEDRHQQSSPSPHPSLLIATGGSDRMILVTGGTGYVGSRLVQKIAEQGRPVRLIARDVAAARGQVPDGIEVVAGDVTEPGTLRPALAGVDTVIHLVAIIRERGAATFERINYAGTVHVVDAAKGAGVR